MTNEEAHELVASVAAQLGEHFSSVQILGSWQADGGGTKRVMLGVGDFYARQGLAHEFINADIAHENARHIAQSLNPPDEGDNWKATP